MGTSWIRLGVFCSYVIMEMGQMMTMKLQCLFRVVTERHLLLL